MLRTGMSRLVLSLFSYSPALFFFSNRACSFVSQLGSKVTGSRFGRLPFGSERQREGGREGKRDPQDQPENDLGNDVILRPAFEMQCDWLAGFGRGQSLKLSEMTQGATISEKTKDDSRWTATTRIRQGKGQHGSNKNKTRDRYEMHLTDPVLPFFILQ